MYQCSCGTHFIQKNVVQAHVLQNADTLPPLLGLQYERDQCWPRLQRQFSAPITQEAKGAWQHSTAKLQLTP